MVSETQNNPAHVPDLLRPEVLAAFDRAVFERDGYWVWDNVLTDAGRRQFTASLQNLQDMNDRIIMETDWAAIDYESLGLPLSLGPTAPWRQASCRRAPNGCSRRKFPRVDGTATIYLKGLGPVRVSHKSKKEL